MDKLSIFTLKTNTLHASKAYKSFLLIIRDYHDTTFLHMAYSLKISTPIGWFVDLWPYPNLQFDLQAILAIDWFFPPKILIGKYWVVLGEALNVVVWVGWVGERVLIVVAKRWKKVRGGRQWTLVLRGFVGEEGRSRVCLTRVDPLTGY